MKKRVPDWLNSPLWNSDHHRFSAAPDPPEPPSPPPPVIHDSRTRHNGITTSPPSSSSASSSDDISHSRQGHAQLLAEVSLLHLQWLTASITTVFDLLSLSSLVLVIKKGHIYAGIEKTRISRHS